MRLIDADKTIGHIKTRLLETALNNCTAVCDVSYIYQECADNRIETWVDEMPTVDAVPVVRCKDCRHRDPEDHKCDSGALERAGCIFPVQDDYFCSFGERREDAETD